MSPNVDITIPHADCMAAVLKPQVASSGINISLLADGQIGISIHRSDNCVGLRITGADAYTLSSRLLTLAEAVNARKDGKNSSRRYL